MARRSGRVTRRFRRARWGRHGRSVLENVAVLPSHHGRGIGRALLELAEARATARGCTRIRLFTHVTMVENQALYERIGYVRTHDATEHGFTRVFYEKAADPAVVGRSRSVARASSSG